MRDGGRATGDGCDADCQREPLGGSCGDNNVDAPLEVCDNGPDVPDDGCNPTCNLRGDATVFVAMAGAASIFADNSYVWFSYEASGEIHRLDIQGCIDALASNGTCATQLVVDTGSNGLGAITSDGERVWYAHSYGGSEGPYIHEFSLAACETAGLPCDATPQQVAGTVAFGGHADGVGAAAAIDGLRGLTFYNGKLYFVDGNRGTLRRFDPANRQVTTLVGPSDGSGTPGAIEGYGAAARLGSPRYMTSDNSGFLYLTDNADDRIFRYNVATTYLDAWVGSGARGYNDSSDPTMVELARPRDLTSDGTSIYWAAYLGHTVRQALTETGATTTLAGSPDTCGDTEGTGTAARFGMHYGMAFHGPSNSIFMYSGQFLSANSAPACTNLPDVLWRIQ